MIKLFSLKQQKKDGEAIPKMGSQKKASAAQLRITKGEPVEIGFVRRVEGFRNSPPQLPAAEIDMS